MRWSAIAVLFALALPATAARAELPSNPVVAPPHVTSIAISDFAGASSEEAAQGRDIARVVAADLDRSGKFKLIDPKDSHAETQVQGSVETDANGRIRVEFRLHAC